MQQRPGTADTWLCTPFARGAGVFMGRVTPAGERVFYFRYTDTHGRRPFLPIGPYHPKGGNGGMTLAQAYATACDWSVLYQAGNKDLREYLTRIEKERRTVEAAQAMAAAESLARRLTVRQIFDRWCATDLQPVIGADGKRTGRKDGGAYVRDQFERHVFPSIGDRCIEDVRKADMLAIIDAQKAAGKIRTAAVLLGDLRQMMGFALDRELITADPLATVKKARLVGKAVERNRVLSDREIAMLPAALKSAAMNVRSHAAVWLLLATGARVGELMGTVWSSALPADANGRQARISALQALSDVDGVKVGIVDTEARTWHLLDTKNQRPHTIHLSEFALIQFARLADLREKLPDSDEASPWVFPARDASHPVCVKSFGKQLADRQREPEKRLKGRSKATEALCLPGGRWTAHDLRRTAGTLMAGLGISGDVIDECLNHIIESSVRRTYIRDRREADQARAFDALGERLIEIIRGSKAAPNVITLHSVA